MRFLGAPWRALLWGGLLGLLVGCGNLLGLFEPYELDSLNLRFHLRGPRAPSSPIVIVGIDEDSFDELNLPWPWPRALHARLVETVSRGRPAAIGFDVLFIEPSRFGPDDDRALAEAIERAGNVVLAAAFTVVKDQYFTKRDLNPPLKAIREGATGFGFVNLPTDRDVFVRAGTTPPPVTVTPQPVTVTPQPVTVTPKPPIVTRQPVVRTPLPRGGGVTITEQLKKRGKKHD